MDDTNNNEIDIVVARKSLLIVSGDKHIVDVDLLQDEIFHHVKVNVDLCNPSSVEICESIGQQIENVHTMTITFHDTVDTESFQAVVNALFALCRHRIQTLTIDLGFHDKKGCIVDLLMTLPNLQHLKICSSALLANPRKRAVEFGRLVCFTVYGKGMRLSHETQFFTTWSMPDMTEFNLRDIFITQDILTFIKRHGRRLRTMELSTVEFKFAELFNECPHIADLTMDIRYTLPVSFSLHKLERYAIRGMNQIGTRPLKRLVVRRVEDRFKFMTNRQHFRALRAIQLTGFDREQICAGSSISIDVWKGLVQYCESSDVMITDMNDKLINSEYISGLL